MNIKKIFYVIFLFFCINTCYALDSETSCPTGIVDYKIVYNTMGGNALNYYSHYEQDAVSNDELPVPQRDGYEFNGWYYDYYLTKKVKAKYINEVEYTQKYYPNGCASITVVTLYAKWTKKDKDDVVCDNVDKGFNIIYDSVGGEKIADELICSTCEYDSKLPIPQRDDYEFAGWYYDSKYIKKVDVLNKDELDYEIKKDENGCEIEGLVNLYAKWTENKKVDSGLKINYTIVYHTDGGNGLPNVTVCDGCDTKTELATPVKEGYKFDGWYYDLKYTKKVNTEYLEDIEHVSMTSDGYSSKVNVVDLYAKWKVDIFAVVKKIVFRLLLLIVFIGIIIVILFSYIKKHKNEVKKEEEIEIL